MPGDLPPIGSGGADESGARAKTPLGDARLKHGGLVASVALSPDGRRTAPGATGGTAWLWDAGSAPLVRTW